MKCYTYKSTCNKVDHPCHCTESKLIVNGWDKSIVDPDPQKKYTLGTELAASQLKQADDECKLGAR